MGCKAVWPRLELLLASFSFNSVRDLFIQWGKFCLVQPDKKCTSETYSRGGEGFLLFHLIPSFVCVLHWWMSASDSPRQTSPGLKTVRHFPSQSSCSQLYHLSLSLPRILSVFLALGGGAGGWDDLGNLFCSFEFGQLPETSFSMTAPLQVPPYSLEALLPFLYTHLVASGKKISSF